MAVSPFVPFGPAHLGALGATALVAALTVALARRRPAVGLALARPLALLLVALELGLCTAERRGGAAWGDVLPLQLCDVALLAAVWALWTGQRLAGELLWFWGGAGTTLALVTPDLAQGPAHLRFWAFFVLHGGVIVAAALVVWGLRRPPGPGAAWRAFAATNAYALVLAGVNWVFGTNFLYLCRKPGVPTLLDHFGPWPLYLLVGEAVALVLFHLLALPFRGRPGPSPAGSGSG